MGENGNDWRELREFAGVDLPRSFVLSWEMLDETLTLDIDLCLGADHPFYEEPRPSEGICIRPATLEFPYCTSIHAGDADEAQSLKDTAAGLGHGRIEGLTRTGDGQYRIAGSFGVVRIDAERPVLRLKEL